MLKANFKKRSLQKELIDDLDLNDSTLINNLKEMALLNSLLGYNKALIRGINQIYKKHKSIFLSNEITIADIGCGSGDSLRSISNWFLKKSVKINLLGIDANPTVLQYAQNASINYPEIQYQLQNILDENTPNEKPEQTYDIVVLNNICHHFNDDTIITLIKKLKNQTRLAIIINDIHRTKLAYYGILLITRLAFLSSVTKNDAPLSVLKSFIYKDLCKILNQTNIPHFKIKWVWPFRWQVIIEPYFS